MIAAIYARKSTGQHVADDAKSVTRQVANAKAFAAAKGWTVTDDLIFVDDGVSGAETKKLLERTRMIELAAKGRFDVIVMQAQDRFSRRDGAEALVELKALAKHVAIWFYGDGTKFEYGALDSNTMAFLKQEFAAEERRKASKRTHEAMRRRAEQGYVTGGRTYGYDSVRCNGVVERVVNPKEAAVVADIFGRYANGEGFKTITYALNAGHVPSPRAKRAGWDPGTVQAILKRPIYRGTVIWNKTTKRDDDGMRHRGRQPKKDQAKWVIIDLPQFRLVEPDVIARVDARLEERRHKYLRDQKGRLLGSPKRHGHQPTRNLLGGFIACQCGATFEAVKGRYVCSARRRKGPSVCASVFSFAVEGIDDVFLHALEDVVLSPEFIDRLLDDAFAHHDATAERSVLEREAEALAAEITNITRAIVAGGDIPALADALKTRDSRLRKIRAVVAQPVVSTDRETLRAALELRATDWRTILRGPHIEQARIVLHHLIELPIRVVSDVPVPIR